MRLLIVGSSQKWAIEHHYVRYLRQFGVDVFLFSPSDYINYHLLNRIILRTGALTPYINANRALLEIVEELSPIIVWVFKGTELYPKTLKIIKQKGIKLVNYNPDHPYIRTSFSHGGSNVEDSVPIYDLHFCYNALLMNVIKQKYGIDCVYLPFAYEMGEGIFEEINSFEEKLAIGFVGNPDENRARTVVSLSKKGFNVDVYGHGWRYFLPKHTNLGVFEAIHDLDFWKVLREYRVQLNLFRPHNVGSHNMRTFEVPAAGGVMLAPDSLEHRSFFSEGKEAFYFKNELDMLQKCHFLLDLPDVTPIRKSAREVSVNAGYSYQNRAFQVWETFQNLI